MDQRQARLDILRRVESGELDLAEGNRLLAQVEQTAAGLPAAAVSTQPILPASVVIPSAAQPAVTILPPENPIPASVSISPEPGPAADPIVAQLLPGSNPAQESSPPLKGWRGLWAVVFVLGILLTLVSTNWIYLGFTAAGLGWGFWLSFFPLALGIGLLWAGWEMRYARWLNIHIQQPDGSRPHTISFGLPLPIGLTRWALQRFGHYSPINRQDLGEFLEEMDRSVNGGNPVQVFVNDDSGAKVEIWIDGPGK